MIARAWALVVLALYAAAALYALLVFVSIVVLAIKQALDTGLFA